MQGHAFHVQDQLHDAHESRNLALWVVLREETGMDAWLPVHQFAREHHEPLWKAQLLADSLANLFQTLLLTSLLGQTLWDSHGLALLYISMLWEISDPRIPILPQHQLFPASYGCKFAFWEEHSWSDELCWVLHNGRCLYIKPSAEPHVADTVVGLSRWGLHVLQLGCQPLEPSCRPHAWLSARWLVGNAQPSELDLVSALVFASLSDDRQPHLESGWSVVWRSHAATPLQWF